MTQAPNKRVVGENHRNQGGVFKDRVYDHALSDQPGTLRRLSQGKMNAQLLGALAILKKCANYGADLDIQRLRSEERQKPLPLERVRQQPQ